jgi:hypothetical protein
MAWLIRRMCRKYAGIEVSPHKFRHLAAKVLLDDSPSAFELVKQLLGHENLKTIANCYAGIDTRRAARHHHYLLERVPSSQSMALRRQGPKRRKIRKILCEPKKTGENPDAADRKKAPALFRMAHRGSIIMGRHIRTGRCL